MNSDVAKPRSQRGLWAGFLGSAEAYPDRPAVVVEGKTLSYRQLHEIAWRVAATIQAHAEFSDPPLTAVFAYRSATAFAGILGSLLAGNGYVPLNRTFPTERTEVMFERSGCRSIIVDAGSFPQLGTLLDKAPQPLLVIIADVSDSECERARRRFPRHLFFGEADLKISSRWQEPASCPDAIAYLLFTSGSTGIPKGVMVAHRNVTAFLDYMVERYAITEQDRLSQMFDMSFDLSVFDMFVAWERGACVCCPPQRTLIKPGSFIRAMELTIWFSVPSTAVFMNRLGDLKPGRYPTLRWILFCGEPLPVSTAEAWLQAAPNTTLENLYGPTELTIACTLYRWNAHGRQESELGIVPIGYAYPEMRVLVADPDLHEVAAGEEGELLMSGPQMSLGYWKDPQKTAAAFVIPPGRHEIFYRTGDRVRKPRGNGPLTHLGRVDFQVKILGHRVELGEIEAVVREACGLDGVVAVGWPVTPSGYGGIEVFIEGKSGDVEQLSKTLASKLPEYMVPKRFHFLDKLPRNVNYKFDRKAMTEMLINTLQ